MYCATPRAGALRAGLWPAWNRDIFANHGATGDWLRHNESIAALRRMYVLGELGVPIAYAVQGARVSALSGPLPNAFSRQDLEQMFSGGVLLDAEAARSLTDHGAR